jgi:dinuclear metal center YbgI/SA1388 family protein
MIPRLSDILGLLEEIAPSSLAESWDNPGMQVGSYSQKIKKIYVALDPTLEALKTASKADAQLLLTHHPLIFRPISNVDMGCFPGNVIAEAATKGISVVGVHTNLDVSKGGLNDILAKLLGLEKIEVLKEINGFEGAGFGRIGFLPETSQFQPFVEKVKGILGTKTLRVIPNGEGKIRKVSVVTGSGGSLISLASEKGADVLLTGDVNHHQALEAKSLNLALIDGGHFNTEKSTFRIFAEQLRDIFMDKSWDVVIQVDEKEVDPLCGGP